MKNLLAGELFGVRAFTASFGVRRLDCALLARGLTRAGRQDKDERNRMIYFAPHRADPAVAGASQGGAKATALQSLVDRKGRV